MRISDWSSDVCSSDLADDLAAAIKGRKSIDEEGAVPAVVARAIRAGQNPVFAWRRYNGMTQADLADRVDVTQAAIARLEAAPVGSGRRTNLEATAEAPGRTTASPNPSDNERERDVTGKRVK